MEGPTAATVATAAMSSCGPTEISTPCLISHTDNTISPSGGPTARGTTNKAEAEKIALCGFP